MALLDDTQLPIAVFDSGMGGLTVLKNLIKNFPNENFLYLGDTARLPYGTKSPSTIQKYVSQVFQFLLKQKIKAIVVACNSASSVLNGTEKISIPLYEVIGPGAKTALQVSSNLHIGVIATRTTVAQKAYEKAIISLNPQAKVFHQACPLLVPLTEEGWIEDPITNLVVYRYLSSLKNSDIDTLVLGCTHYPLLREVISRVMGHTVHLIDSGEAISEQIKLDIKKRRFLANSLNNQKGNLEIYITDLNDHFQAVAENILSPLKASRFHHVDLREKLINKKY